MRGVRHLHIQRSVLIICLLLAACVGFALATGFWLLFRLAYVLLAAVPLCFLWARFNIARLDVSIERPADRAQVGQPFEERLTVRNKSLFPKVGSRWTTPRRCLGITLDARSRSAANSGRPGAPKPYSLDAASTPSDR